MGKANFCSILLIGFLTFTPFVLAGDESQDESINSIEDEGSGGNQREKFQKSVRKRLGLDDPIHTISLETNGIGEYRITDENRVKLVLRQPQKGMEIVVWNSRSLNEARDFIQLVKKGAVRSAMVRNGRILEILLQDKAIQ